MKPARYGPFPYLPPYRRPKLTWPGNARVALWVIPNVEIFSLLEPMAGNHNERLSKPIVPGVRPWAQRDYGNRIGIWRIFDVLQKHGVRGTMSLNSDVCRFHPEIVQRAVEFDWAFMGHCRTNVNRLNELSSEGERDEITGTLSEIEAFTGRRPIGWLGAGLAESWNTLDYLIDAGVQYVCDWTNDDQPYRMKVDAGTILSVPYSYEVNDIPQFYYMKRSNSDFEDLIRRQFDTLYEEGAESGRVMAICLHPWIIGVPHRIRILDSALSYILRHEQVWRATGDEIARHYLSVTAEDEERGRYAE